MYSRRDVLRVTAAALMAPLPVAGCAGTLTRQVASPVGGQLAVPLSAFRDGEAEHYIIQVSAQGVPFPILLSRDPAEDAYVALSARCTHLGCTVRVGAESLRCPCHHSVFDRSGAPLSGPAPKPLTSFPCVRAGDVILITLS
jgi:nitrite reductase/ring-hydroxylating ferredoxin subunit